MTKDVNNNKKRLKAVVTRDVKDKTVSVSVEVLMKHPIYLKRYTFKKKFLVHSDLGVKKGDKVLIEETRPYSRNVTWKIVKIFESVEAQK
jgi:small subunit ribosomal protein S17